MENNKLTHLDSDGNANMVDVGEKPISHRMARAKGQVVLLPATVEMIKKGLMKKGDVLTVAKIAGIQAAKKTSELIPLCHPLIINKIEHTQKNTIRICGTIPFYLQLSGCADVDDQ